MRAKSRWLPLAVGLGLSVLALPLPCIAESRRIGAFEEKVILRAGAMWSNHDTSLRLSGDTGVGIGVDLEDAFALQEEIGSVAQFSVLGRFKERHRMGLQVYSFSRSADSVLDAQWEGEDVTVEAGAQAQTKLKIGIADLSYAYSFISDDKHEFAGTVGLFWMDLEFDIALRGEILGEDGVMEGEAEVSASLRPPLPVFGVNYNYAANSRWLTEVSIQYFTLRTDLINGGLVKISADTRYYLWDRLEVGGGLTLFDLGVTVDTSDLKGRFDWSFWGPQLFLGWRF